ncbi:hypothetical protein [Planomonospora sp. ID82291]|uniref:hypothetical protein n=1 Tax=Planomonospora sp. ID82291 TaxID=2738136 RepID=UPI0018C3ADC2|nr:hypothetical protein [Planomonospora sp. ID82291]MBG0819042.1 hypothetical protein [Planomonospora sp. ID82291]
MDKLTETERRDFARAAAEDLEAAVEERLVLEQEYEHYTGPLGWSEWLKQRNG